MDKRQCFSFYSSDPTVNEHLTKVENRTEYIMNLIRADIKGYSRKQADRFQAQANDWKKKADAEDAATRARLYEDIALMIKLMPDWVKYNRATLSDENNIEWLRGRGIKFAEEILNEVRAGRIGLRVEDHEPPKRGRGRPPKFGRKPGRPNTGEGGN